MKKRLGLIALSLNDLPVSYNNLHLLLNFIDHDVPPVRESVYINLYRFKQFKEAEVALKEAIKTEKHNILIEVLNECLEDFNEKE